MERSDHVLLDAGSGGRASQRFINELFVKHFDNEILATRDDAALLPSIDGKMAISTDGYTVSPLFFAGASIGSLAINGTVNDVAMLGAAPLWLSAAFIIEEGLPIETLEQVICDMREALKKADVKIVTGDTKVVPQGACDKLFITTTGIGRILGQMPPSGNSAIPGDVILLSGAVGDHGLAVMAAREKLSFLESVNSDCAPLNHMIRGIIENASAVHTLRDPTRGGLATTLNEIAEQSLVTMEIWEDRIPIHANVRDGSSLLGLDPLYLANEGKCICIVPPEEADAALQAMKSSLYGLEAAIIGEVTSRKPGKVILHTTMGGERYLGMLEGAPLPRIC